jgi:hypothetical protein
LASAIGLKEKEVQGNNGKEVSTCVVILFGDKHCNNKYRFGG